MGALIYALVFGVSLGFLSADAQTPWLKVLAGILAFWMFLAAVLQGIRLTRDSE